MASWLDNLVTPNAVLDAQAQQADNQVQLNARWDSILATPGLTAGQRSAVLADKQKAQVTDAVTGNFDAGVKGTRDNIRNFFNGTGSFIVGAVPWWIWVVLVLGLALYLSPLWLPLLNRRAAR